jgi:hypothetical protein
MAAHKQAGSVSAWSVAGDSRREIHGFPWLRRSVTCIELLAALRSGALASIFIVIQRAIPNLRKWPEKQAPTRLNHAVLTIF